MSTFVNTVDVIGDKVLTRSILTNTITEILDDKVANVGRGTFYECDQLITVDFPSATRVDSQAFYSCENLVTANIPQTSNIGGNAFFSCEKLVAADFPEAESVGSYAFQNCLSLKSANIPKATTIGDSAFYGCKALETVTALAVTQLAGRAFYECQSLTTLSFPAATKTTGYNAFYNCEALTVITMPSLTSLYGSEFSSCNNLKMADLGLVEKLPLNVFSYCSKLDTLILRKTDGICTLPGNYLNETSLRKDTSYIYVPAALVDTYKSATNWSAYAERFRALEDYTVDSTTTGALDESKI